MIQFATRRRGLIAATALLALAGCRVVPKGAPDSTPRQPEAPSATVLPTDQQRHRIALLVPLIGANASVGQSIANAATMALLDTNASNLRITNYDTSAGAAVAAAKAVADGNRLILGPLMAGDIAAVSATARASRVPVISFSNDESAASREVFVMGSLPGQSIARTIAYARTQGLTRFGGLVPTGDYGQRASTALMTAVRSKGGSMVAMESFERTGPAAVAAAQRLKTKGGFEAVLIADGARMAAAAAPVLRAATGTAPGAKLLGADLWSGEALIGTTPSLRGAWFAAISDSRFKQFADSYRTRFGAAPYRVATLGYDSVLLTLRVARDWKPGTAFPTAQLLDKGGFLGLDGPFRFNANGIVERALEVREVRTGGVTIVSPAPTKFED